MFIKIKGGATAAKGFSAAACEAGIKYKDRTDMAMLYAEGMCRAAGTFTTNVVKAAPVLWDRQIVSEKGAAQAVVINSGIANACTGEEGMRYCRQTAEAAAEALGIPQRDWKRLQEGIKGSTSTVVSIRLRQLNQRNY